MIEVMALSENGSESELSQAANVSNWKENVIDMVGRMPTETNFFLAETYLRFHGQAEPLLKALMKGDCETEQLVNRLTAKRLCGTPVCAVVDELTRDVRFRYVTLSYPFRFPEEVIAPLCSDPETSLITTFVNTKKKGYSEKRIGLTPSEVRSSAYWGIKRKATLPEQLWAYDLTQCDPQLEAQNYRRRIFPIFSMEHMEDYLRTGRVSEEADYQFFLDGKYSYIDLSRSWVGAKDLEEDWEDLNAFVGIGANNEESCQ